LLAAARLPLNERIRRLCSLRRIKLVSAVDIKSMKEITRIPVGEVPKRNITAVLP
jgi:hypothetical protein